MFYVYILQSEVTKRYYFGYTNDLNRRLQEHNSNKTQSLKNGGPFKIVHVESFEDSTSARRRELQIKSYKGGNAFRNLVNKQLR